MFRVWESWTCTFWTVASFSIGLYGRMKSDACAMLCSDPSGSMAAGELNHVLEACYCITPVNPRRDSLELEILEWQTGSLNSKSNLRNSDLRLDLEFLVSRSGAMVCPRTQQQDRSFLRARRHHLELITETGVTPCPGSREPPWSLGLLDLLSHASPSVVPGWTWASCSDEKGIQDRLAIRNTTRW